MLVVIHEYVLVSTFFMNSNIRVYLSVGILLQDMVIKIIIILIAGQDTIMSTLNELHTRNYVCSVFAGLSGNTDQDLFPMSGELSHIRDDVSEILS